MPLLPVSQRVKILPFFLLSPWLSLLICIMYLPDHSEWTKLLSLCLSTDSLALFYHVRVYILLLFTHTVLIFVIVSLLLSLTLITCRAVFWNAEACGKGSELWLGTTLEENSHSWTHRQISLLNGKNNSTLLICNLIYYLR